MFENKALRKIFGLKKYEVREKFLNSIEEKLGDLYRLTRKSIDNTANSIQAQYGGYVAGTEENGMRTKFRSGIFFNNVSLEELGESMVITSSYILGR